MMEGKTILITGANRGIGKSLAKNFSNIGANVILLGKDVRDVVRGDGNLFKLCFDATQTQVSNGFQGRFNFSWSLLALCDALGLQAFEQITFFLPLTCLRRNLPPHLDDR